LTGLLCAGARADSGNWLDALQLDFDDPGLSGNAVLRDFHQRCAAQFATDPARIEPLLPEHPQPLSRRGDALVEWCRGFLGGFGLAGATAHAQLPQDAREILADLGTIAASHFDYGDDGTDEQALADLLDFVRTGVALLHRDVRRAADAGRRSLH
jgi:uncharacterized protein YgfB (UPF0149 family)